MLFIFYFLFPKFPVDHAISFFNDLKSINNFWIVGYLSFMLAGPPSGTVLRIIEAGPALQVLAEIY